MQARARLALVHLLLVVGCTAYASEREKPVAQLGNHAYTIRTAQGEASIPHPQDFQQQLWFVRGVAHVGSRMVESPCAVAAVFGHGNCAAAEGADL